MYGSVKLWGFFLAHHTVHEIAIKDKPLEIRNNVRMSKTVKNRVHGIDRFIKNRVDTIHGFPKMVIVFDP